MMNFTKSLKAAIVLCLLCVATAMSAATSLSLGNLTIAPGETKSVDVILKNDAVVGSLEFCITLPAGLTMVEESIVPNAERIEEDAYFIFADPQDDGTIRFAALDQTGEGIAPGEGPIFSFTVIADETLTDGSINITNQEVTDTEGGVEETTVEPAVVEKGEPTFELQAAEQLTIAEGETQDIDVVLVNSGDLLGFQVIVKLPEGIVLGGESEKASITATDRLKGFTKSVQAQEAGTYKVMFTTMTNKLIAGNSGDPLFTITVKAEQEVKNVNIVLTDGRATNVERQTVNFADVTINVNPQDEPVEPVEPVEPAEASASYVVQEGETFTSGQTVEVKSGDEVVATITYGEEGGADFKAAKAAGNIEGYVAFTEGNGENGDKEGGTFYTIVPEYNGSVSVAVMLNSGKKFFIEEDGEALEAYNGITVDEKYYGTYSFDVNAGSSYKVYCAGSKLGFFGFDYTYVDDGGTTAISTIETSAPQAEGIYTLAGQRVKAATKGLYIINGKKVLVK